MRRFSVYCCTQFVVVRFLVNVQFLVNNKVWSKNCFLSRSKLAGWAQNWWPSWRRQNSLVTSVVHSDSDSDLCLYWGSQETLQHLLVSCPLLRTFWSDVLTRWNSSSTCNILFDELKILYGYNSGVPRCLLLNYYILIAKFHIFR